MGFVTEIIMVFVRDSLIRGHEVCLHANVAHEEALLETLLHLWDPLLFHVRKKARLSAIFRVESMSTHHWQEEKHGMSRDLSPGMNRRRMRGVQMASRPVGWWMNKDKQCNPGVGLTLPIAGASPLGPNSSPAP